MYRQIQQLVVPGAKALFGQHIAAYLFGAGERTGILEAHDLEQIGVLIAVFLAADAAAVAYAAAAVYPLSSCGEIVPV